MVGCKGATDADFAGLAGTLGGGLRKLAVGGAALTWREEAALTGEGGAFGWLFGLVKLLMHSAG